MAVSVKEIIDEIIKAGLEHETDVNTEVVLHGPVNWSDFDGQGLAFCVSNTVDDLMSWKNAQGCLIICDRRHREALAGGPFLFSDNPRSVFAVAASLFAPAPPTGIHPTALVDENAVIGKNVSIGPYSVIGAATIGDNVTIGGHVCISDHVKLGDDVVVRDAVQLGADGLGSVKDGNGKFRLFPHFSDVNVGNGVVFGTGTIIFRGVLSPTVIGEYTDFSARCFVGHNTVIGTGVFCGANSHIAGSVTIGDNCWLSQGCGIRNNVSLPDRTTVGMNAAITRSLTEPGQTIVCAPVKNLGSMFGLGA